MSDVNQIRQTIQDSVARITGISPTEIHDTSRYREDLGLDSLSSLEVVIDLEYAFRIKVPETQIQTIATVQDTIAVVQQHLAAGPAATPA